MKLDRATLTRALLGSILLCPGLLSAAPASFADNPIIYFLITDRFNNGNPANDHSYGREREATPAKDVATFHGGDLKGVTDKLKEGWFKQLGVNALDHGAVRADPRLGGGRRQGLQALRLPWLLRPGLHRAGPEHGHPRGTA